MKGVEELTEYVVNEIQDVYRLQGVEISDKHIECILRQMLRKVEVTESGDTDLIIGDQLELSEVLQQNKKASSDGGIPAKFKRLLLGITKHLLLQSLLFQLHLSKKLQEFLPKLCNWKDR